MHVRHYSCELSWVKLAPLATVRMVGTTASVATDVRCDARSFECFTADIDERSNEIQRAARDHDGGEPGGDCRYARAFGCAVGEAARIACAISTSSRFALSVQTVVNAAAVERLIPAQQ